MLVGYDQRQVHFGVHVTFASVGLSNVYLRSCKYGNKLNHCMSIKQAKLITSGSHPRAVIAILHVTQVNPITQTQKESYKKIRKYSFESQS